MGGWGDGGMGGWGDGGMGGQGDKEKFKLLTPNLLALTLINGGQNHNCPPLNRYRESRIYIFYIVEAHRSKILRFIC